MALTFNGSTSLLEYVGSLGLAYPVSMFAWVKSANSSQTAGILSSCVPDGADLHVLQISTTMSARSRSTLGTTSSIVSSEAVAAGTWKPLLITFPGETSRNIFHGAAWDSGSGTNVANPATHTKFVVGKRGYLMDLPYLGDVAEVAIWSGYGLLQADFDLLAAGAAPETVQPTYLVDAWSLQTAAATQTGVNGTVLTATATTTAANHPISRSAGVASVDLSGLVSGESFGTLSVQANVPSEITLTGIASDEAFGALSAAVVAPDPSYEIRSNGIQTLTSQPLSAFKDGHTYAGWVTSAGTVGLTKYNHAAGTAQDVTLATGMGGNNHASSTVHLLPDGRIACFWSMHNDATGVRYRITTSGADIATFAAEQVLAVGGNTAYNNPHYLSVPNRHYVHYRVNVNQCRARSTADFVTWDTERAWITNGSERPYVVSRSNGADRIDFFFSSAHPGDTTTCSMYHAYMTVSAAGVETWHQSDGTVITAPATPANATLVYDGTTVKGWNPDIQIDRHGNPWVLFQRFVTPGSDHRHTFSRWTGSEWTPVTEICAAGGDLQPGVIWSDGQACLDSHNPAVCYATVTVSGRKRLQEWRTDDFGATWYYVRDLTTTTAHDAFTPSSPIGNDGRAACVFNWGTATSYTNFSSTLRAVSGPRIEVEMTDRTGATLAANLSGLNYAVLGAATPDASPSIVASGINGATDALGVFRAAAPAVSGAAFVVVTDSDGNPASSHDAFAGPVTVV